MKELEQRPIGKYIDQLNGFAFKSELFNQDDSGIRLCRGINITRGKLRFDSSNEMFWNDESIDLKKYLLDQGDIVISMDGSLVGRNFAIVQNDDLPLLLVQRVARLRAKVGLSQGFLYQWIASDHFIKYVDSVKTSSGIPHISASQINEFKITFLPYQEQQKIASILYKWDETIEAQIQLIEAKEKQKKGLMQKLLTGEVRFPGFEDEWEKHTIQELLNIGYLTGHLDGNHGSLYPKAEEFVNEGIPYVAANSFINGKVDFKRCKFLSLERANTFKKGIAHNGDVLFAHNATVGPVAKLDTELDFVILSTTATYFRCNNKKLLNNFLFQFLQSDFFIQQYQAVMGQSTRNQVPITIQKTFLVIVPNVKEQQKIASILSAMDEEIQTLKVELEDLKLQKKGLMQELLTGKIRVKN